MDNPSKYLTIERFRQPSKRGDASYVTPHRYCGAERAFKRSMSSEDRMYVLKTCWIVRRGQFI